MKIKPTNFKTFGHLSIKALDKITPYMIEGLSYDRACEKAGYDFRKKALSLESITNPVVKRAISQTNKVVDAIILKYGKPYYIKVETARDLAKNFKDRKSIERENKENQAKNQSIVETLKEHGIINPTGQQILKVKLYREQNGKCMYSGKAIDFEEMMRDDNAYQIDHIVPFSRSNNDGLTNKVLVYSEENQLKGNKTPFEYMSSNKERWDNFVNLVETTYKTKDVKTSDKSQNQQNYKFNGYAFKKKANLLLEDYKNDSWNVRALNDTRYMTKFIKNLLENTVDFTEGEEKKRVFTPNGTITSYLRKRWNLSKVREDNVLHHAADAAIVAAIDSSIILRANLRAKKREVQSYLHSANTVEEKQKIMESLTNKETGEIIDEMAFSEAQKEKLRQNYDKYTHEAITEKEFPQPWPNFAKEVYKRTLPKDSETIRNELRGLEKYDDEFRESVKAIFVSRMPRHKVTGSAHKETIRSPKIKDGNQRSIRKPINTLKKKDIENSKIKDSDAWLYKEMMRRLDESNNNPEKAFKEPLYKNNKTKDKNGRPISPVTTIKVYTTEPSGFYINNKKAFVNNGSMVRLDIYKKPNKKGKIEHYFVPVYVHQIGKNKPAPTKILPQPKGFTDVDESFEKVCSVYPNDYLRIELKGEIKEGYYVGYDISSGTIAIIKHDSADKNNINRISARGADKIIKINVPLLGL